MTIGQRITQIRADSGLTQEAFGEKLGTTRQTVSKWELDQTLPELEKLVKICRLFSVSADSLLLDGIDNFDVEYENFACGVYKSYCAEAVETEKLALLYESNADKSQLSAKAYVGQGNKKALRAACLYDATAGKTFYAYKTNMGRIISNDQAVAKMLGESFNPTLKTRLQRTERFFVSHEDKPLKTVGEAGIKNCLMQWRMSDSLVAGDGHFQIFLCTGVTEYIFSIHPQDTNIYCGISFNIPHELGMFGGGQFFRLRNYKDNSEPFCRFYADLGRRANAVDIPTMECVSGQCVQTSKGLSWGLKRYTDDEIVLQGCGNDEYVYRRTDRALERFSQGLCPWPARDAVPRLCKSLFEKKGLDPQKTFK